MLISIKLRIITELIIIKRKTVECQTKPIDWKNREIMPTRTSNTQGLSTATLEPFKSIQMMPTFIPIEHSVSSI